MVPVLCAAEQNNEQYKNRNTKLRVSIVMRFLTWRNEHIALHQNLLVIPLGASRLPLLPVVFPYLSANATWKNET